MMTNHAVARIAQPASLAVLIAVGLGLSGARLAKAESIDEKAALCAACHGENGVPQEPSSPVIWGQQPGYAYLQLRDFKRGNRANEQMAAIASTLERDDMMALAEYFSKKPWPNLSQPRALDAVASQAIRADASVGCTGCHLESYQGDGSVPRLAGQSRDYMAKTIADFRSHARANNPGMSSLMNATSESDLAALTNYLAGL